MTLSAESTRRITGPVFTVVLACYAAAALGTVLGQGSLFGLGTGIVCVDAPNLAVPMSSTPLTVPGAAIHSEGAELCVPHADAGQHALAVLIGLPGPALFLGALYLLYRMLREAERAGVFGDRVAARLRTLGWFLLVGQLARMVITGSATTYFVASVSKLDSGTPLGIGYWQWSVPTLLAGLGTLTFARIMRVGARMREDLDGTV